jgi:hypothetical protein
MAWKKIGNINDNANKDTVVRYGKTYRKVGNVKDMAGGSVKQNTQQNLQNAQNQAQKYADEAKQANSWQGMLKNTITGIPNAIKQIGSNVVNHPVDTALSVGSGVYQGLKPLMNVQRYTNPATLIPQVRQGQQKMDEMMNYKPQTQTGQDIQSGFEFAGATAPYEVAGTAIGAIPRLAKTPILAKYLGYAIPGQLFSDKKITDIKGRGEQLALDSLLFGITHGAGKLRKGVPPERTLPEVKTGQGSQVPPQPETRLQSGQGSPQTNLQNVVESSYTKGVAPKGKNVNPLQEGGKTYYHGTPYEIKDGKLSMKFSGTNTENENGAIFFTDNKITAENYSKLPQSEMEAISNRQNDLINERIAKGMTEKQARAGGSVLEAKLDIKNPLTFDAKGKYYDYKKTQELLDTARKNGNDAVIIRNVAESDNDRSLIGTTVAMLDENKIKLSQPQAPLQEGGKTLYRWTGKAKVDLPKDNLFQGVYTSTDKNRFSHLGDKLEKYTLPENAKIKEIAINSEDFSDVVLNRGEKITNKLKNEGYDAVRILGNDGNELETVLLNPKLSQPQGITPNEIPNLTTKGNITTPNFNYKKFIEENLGIRNRTPDTRGFNKPISQIEQKLSQPGVLAVQDLPQGTPRQGLNRYYPNVLRSGERSIENQGTTGKVLLDLMENQRVSGDLQAGKWKALVNKFTGTLNDEQKMNLTDVLEGKAKPMDATVGASSKVMRNLLNKIQGEAVGAGLNTGKLENYFPRKYNWSEMIKSGRKEEIYQHMVDTGQASTKAEAEQFFKDFIIKNSERKAGNLEYERMFDIPGYERDPEKALSMYAETAAKRISEAKSFGKGDETISALINKIADEGGDYKSAQKIFDYVYKGEDKNAFANALLSYNTFTKLSLAFFSNLTQSVNTAAKGGLLNTIKGASQALAQGWKAMKHQKYDDIATLANAFDEHISLQESGLSNKFIKGAMAAFQKVENFNRRVGANTGLLRAKELTGKINNPKSMFISELFTDRRTAAATRQLESLGIKVEDIVNGKLTQEQLLTAANKMAKTTQFKMNALMMPQAWRTPLGKVITQFKGFSFMQTKFIRDEIVKEAKQGNLAPLLRFLAIAPVASYVTQSTRNWVNQANSKTSSDNVDFRKLDLYRKAIGDLPTDIATQLQYANEKKDKWYTTGIKNLKNFSSPVAGPSGGDFLELMSALEQKSAVARDNERYFSKHPLAQKDPNLDLKRFAASKIPYYGRNLTNTVFGYKPTVAEDAKDMARQAIESNDVAGFNEALKKDPYLNSQDAIRAAIGKKVSEMSPTEKKFYDMLKEVNKQKVYNPFYQN